MNVSFGADMPVAPLETGSRMHLFGDTLGSTIVVRGAFHMFARLGTDYEIRNQWFFTILEAMATD